MNAVGNKVILHGHVACTPRRSRPTRSLVFSARHRRGGQDHHRRAVNETTDDKKGTPMSVSTASKTEQDIQDGVEQELAWTREVANSANIGVAVHDGGVSLAGEVGSYSEKVAAAKAAMRSMELGQSPMISSSATPEQRTDAEIARAAHEILRWIAGGPARIGEDRGSRPRSHSHRRGRVGLPAPSRPAGRGKPSRRRRRL